MCKNYESCQQLIYNGFWNKFPEHYQLSNNYILTITVWQS